MKKIISIMLILISNSLLFCANQKTRARRRARLAAEQQAAPVVPVTQTAATDSGTAAIEQQLSELRIAQQPPEPLDTYPLHRAIAHDDAQKLMFLLGTGCYDINGIGKTGRAPIHTAVEYQSVDCVRVLIEHGASLTTRTVMGFTPLHCAASCNNITIAQMLLAKEPTLINMQDMFGCTAMHRAAHDCHFDFVRLLIANRADLDIRDTFDNAPLHCAAQRSNSWDKDQIMLAIADAGSRKALTQNKQKVTPLHIFLAAVLKKAKKRDPLNSRDLQRMINALYYHTIAHCPDDTGVTCEELLALINRYLPVYSKLYLI